MNGFEKEQGETTNKKCIEQMNREGKAKGVE